MSDWKGTQVVIKVVKVGSGEPAPMVYKGFLDTDTMADIFEQYDPQVYSFLIRPQSEAEKDV